MPQTVNGLLIQKQDSPYGIPHPGDTRQFEVEVTPKKEKPNETWNKLKNAKDGFGQQFKVLKVDEREGFESQHGRFVKFSLLLEPLSAPAASSNGTQKDDAIHWGLALKLAAHKAAAGTDDETYVERVHTLANKLLPVVKGGADPKAESVSASDGNPDASEASDSDIPF